MPLRTIPSSFPLVQKNEGNTYKILRASLMRRLAQAQNYLWSKMVRVYGGHGYEGHGCLMQNLPPGDPVQGGVETLSNGQKGRAMCSFYVPRNWCASARVQIVGQYLLTKTTDDTVGTFYAQVYDLFDRPVGVIQSYYVDDDTKTDWSMELIVPQDNDYQIRIFMAFTNGNLGGEIALENTLKMRCVSARYLPGNATELLGQTANATWQPHEDPSTDPQLWWPGASAFFRRIIDNTLHLYSYRAPELCQSWLDLSWHNTSTFTEIGHYVFYSPSQMTKVTGKLHVYVQGSSGAGNEVRVLLNTVVVQTFTALAAGETVLDVTEFTVPDGAENLITIEAKSAAVSTDWGTFVWGVSFWESDTAIAVTIPTDYVPLDESKLRGDKPFVWENDGDGDAAGLIHLMRNDVWLAQNRPRHLIGDWRHRIYKRLTYAPNSLDPSPQTDYYDPRTDWTRGDQQPQQLFAPKNITVNGQGSTEDDQDGFGAFEHGQTDTSDSDLADNNYDTGYRLDGGSPQHALSYGFPFAYTHVRHGRRLGWYVIPIDGLSVHPLTAQSGWRLITRGRRLNPHTMAASGWGQGPVECEPGYIDRAYFDPVYDGTSQEQIPLMAHGVKKDSDKQWHPELRAEHDTASTILFTVRGRLPRAMHSVAGNPLASDTFLEGTLYEVELNSVYLSDLPLTQAQLADL